MSESKNLLEVKHLKQHFDVPNGFSSLKLKAVDDVTFEFALSKPFLISSFSTALDVFAPAVAVATVVYFKPSYSNST